MMMSANGASTLGRPEPQTPTLEGTLQSAINGTGTAVGDLSAALETMAIRLQGVLQPEMPATAAGDNQLRAADPPCGPAVGELRSITLRLESLTRAVHRLIDRCEV